MGFQHVVFDNFVLEQHLCRFSKLRVFRYSLSYVTRWPIDERPMQSLPSLQCLPDLNTLSLYYVLLQYTEKLNVNHLSSVHIENHNRVFPEIVNANKTMKRLNLLGAQLLQNADDVLVSMKDIPRLMLHIHSIQSTSVQIPSGWSSFDYLSLNCPLCGFAGSVQHLTIHEMAGFGYSNISGPLFRVGDGFKCMNLPSQDDRNETFQRKWGIACGSAAATIGTRFHVGREDAWKSTQVLHVSNCSVPTVQNNTLSVYCAARPNEAMPGMFVWGCFESRYFETGQTCHDNSFV
jgi:hypothetical protein